MERITPRPDGLTLVLACTPGSGGGHVARLLGRSGVVPEPDRYFDPLRVPDFRRKWSIPVGCDDWLSRYLTAARRTAEAIGIGAVRVTWTDLVWLAGIGRDGESDLRSDAAVVSSLLIAPLYLFLDRGDPPAQALAWYLARHPEIAATDPDTVDRAEFQEIRWLETLVQEQLRAWSTYFRIHGISPLTLGSPDHRRTPRVAVAQVIRHLGLDVEMGDGAPDSGGRDPRRFDAWMAAYAGLRSRLPAPVGMYRRPVHQRRSMGPPPHSGRDRPVGRNEPGATS